MSSSLKNRRRADYVYWQSQTTRWSDNDQYAHMNNSIAYHLFDTIINSYLIERCGVTPPNSELIGLVVSSHAQYFSALSFPGILDLGLRVVKLGNSSVEYEVGVFEQGKDEPAIVGGYTHVFVGSQSRRSCPMSSGIKRGLDKIQSAVPARL